MTTHASPGLCITVGLLHAGDLGASLARGLVARGLRVVTTADGRSARTVRRCAEAGVELLPSLADVARAAGVVLSVVPPAAAEGVARSYLQCAALAPSGAIYVDANSISPDTAASIAAEVRAHDLNFVDAAVNGLAATVATAGTLFISGTRAAEVAELFTGVVRTRILGAEPGMASAMKMLLSGLSKGICGLYLELGLAAHAMDMDTALAEECGRIYPGVWALVERMLPTYAQHAGRRATETAEVEQTARAAGVNSIVLRAVREAHQALASALAAGPAEPPGESVENFIRRLAEGNFMSEMSPPRVEEAGVPASHTG